MHTRRIIPFFLHYETPDGWRLTAALLLAVLVHGAILLGLHLTSSPKTSHESVVTLNVTLLQRPGGEPMQAPLREVEPALPPPTSQPWSQRPTPLVEPAMPPSVALSPARETATAAMIEPLPTQSSAPPATIVATIAEPENALVATPPAAAAGGAPVPQQLATEPAQTTRKSTSQAARLLPPAPSAMDLMTRGLQIARSNPNPNPESTKAREKYINPKAMTTPERFYMEAWRRKVERVGTMNFPDEARRRNLTGKLILDVALLADGSVKNIRLVRSSGQPVLDDAAQRIVRLGAPYAQFPDELRRQFDVLHIVRTWEFLPGNTLRGK